MTGSYNSQPVSNSLEITSKVIYQEDNSSTGISINSINQLGDGYEASSSLNLTYSEASLSERQEQARVLTANPEFQAVQDEKASLLPVDEATAPSNDELACGEIVDSNSGINDAELEQMLSYFQAQEYKNLPDFEYYCSKFKLFQPGLESLQNNLERVSILSARQAVQENVEDAHNVALLSLGAMEGSVSSSMGVTQNVERVIQDYKKNSLFSTGHIFALRCANALLTIIVAPALAWFFAIPTTVIYMLVGLAVFIVEAWNYYAQRKLTKWEDFRKFLESSDGYIQRKKDMTSSEILGRQAAALGRQSELIGKLFQAHAQLFQANEQFSQAHTQLFEENAEQTKLLKEMLTRNDELLTLLKKQGQSQPIDIQDTASQSIAVPNHFVSAGSNDEQLLTPPDNAPIDPRQIRAAAVAANSVGTNNNAAINSKNVADSQ